MDRDAVSDRGHCGIAVYRAEVGIRLCVDARYVSAGFGGNSRSLHYRGRDGEEAFLS